MAMAGSCMFTFANPQSQTRSQHFCFALGTQLCPYTVLLHICLGVGVGVCVYTHKHLPRERESEREVVNSVSLYQC